MKKIIATVLAMVMALALCTTAMAATTSTSTVNGTTTTLSVTDDYNLRTLGSNAVATPVNGAIAYTTISTKTVTTDGKETKTYLPASYSITATVGGNAETYYVCDANLKDAMRLFKGDTFVAYVTKDSTVAGFVTPAGEWLPAGTLVSKGTDCGAYSADGVKFSTSLKVASAGNDAVAGVAVVDGKLVGYTSNDVGTVSHDFTTGATVTYKANSTTPVSVVCKTCKKSFAVVKTNELGTYAGKTMAGDNEKATAIGSADYAIKLDVATTDTPTNTTTSPKTFDAGIAMYVGMALTSVAGSAVVIGKKKEF